MADPRHLKFSASLQLNSRARAFVKKAPGASEAAMRKVLKEARKLAKENVAKGKGPSPHTGKADKWGHNWPHEDTGDLADSVEQAIWLQGFLTEGTIYTDLEYGAYLEVGWRQGGQFYRYPWMKPAFLQAMKKLPAMAAETFRYQMKDLDEDRTIYGPEIESWADAAERWAKGIQEEIAKASQPKSPEIPPKFEPKFTPVGRFINQNALRNKGGRPKDSAPLGEELARSRKRDQERERIVDNAKKFDTKRLRLSQRSSEATHRSELDPNDLAEKYKREQEAQQRRIDKERKQLRQEQEERKRNAEKLQNAAIEELAKANDRLRAAADAMKKPDVKLKSKKKKK